MSSAARVARRVVAALLLVALCAGPAGAQPDGDPEEADAGIRLLDLPTHLTGAPLDVTVEVAPALAETGARLQLTLLDAVGDTDELRDVLDQEATTAQLLQTRVEARPGRQTLRLEAPGLPAGVYPLELRLLAAGGDLAVLRTAVVVPRAPDLEADRAPLPVGLLVLVDEPAGVAVAGSPPGDLLVRDLRTGRGLPAVLDGLRTAPPVPVTLVVDPLTVEVLDAAVDGYATRDEAGALRLGPSSDAAGRARRARSDLRALADRPGTTLVAAPYAQADLAALGGAGLTEIAGRAVGVGRRRAEQLVAATLPGSLWAPTGLGASGVDVVIDSGVDRLLLPGTVPGSTAVRGPQVLRVRGRSGAALDVLVTDAQLDGVVTRAADRPGALFANEVLAHLALIQDSRAPVAGGDAALLVVPGDLQVQAADVRRLVDGLATAPHLRAVPLGNLAPGEPVEADPADLPRSPRLSGPYVETIAETRRATSALSQLLPGGRRDAR